MFPLPSLNERAQQLGFSLVGIVPAVPARRLDAYLAWVAAEMHGQMGYLARPDRLDRRRDLNVILPGVQTIICVGLDYQTIALAPEIAADPSRGRISNYAWGADYHDIMTPRLEELASWLAGETRRMGSRDGVAHRVYVDTGAILERDHAEQAGLGFTGKNTMLLHPRRGSFFFLGEILSTLKITTSPAQAKSVAMPTCGRCTRCLDICPTAAFPEPYVLDARRCISYLTIELKTGIPVELRPLMGHWIYGCDDCQTVCPFNRFAPEAVESAFRPGHIDRAAPPLVDLLALDEGGFQARFKNSPLRRIGRERLVRNACVAAGNWGDPRLAGLLGNLLHDPSRLVGDHAAWALSRLNHDAGLPKLADYLALENDGALAQEITGYLGNKKARDD